MRPPILEVDQVSKLFRPRGLRLFGTHRAPHRALDDVSFRVERGETFGIVGESGSGKTTLARLLAGLAAPSAGTIRLEGRDLLDWQRRDRQAMHRRVQLIFQDPYASLDPTHTVFDILAEPALVHRLCRGAALEARIQEMLERVGLPTTDDFMAKAPGELSGGERQRVGIGRSLMTGADVIVADEPVSMLDASVKAGVMSLLLRLRHIRALTYVLITHDLALAHRTCDRIAVMHAGRMVELGPSGAVVTAPRHPYTQLLMDSTPPPRPDPGWAALRREFPVMTSADACCSDGCAYYEPCPRKADVCKVKRPPFLEVSTQHFLACHPDSTCRR